MSNFPLRPLLSIGQLLENFRNSPRLQRRAFFGSLALLAAGIVALLVTVLLPSKSHALDTPISNRPADVVKKDPTAPVDPAAIKIARQFLLTAVQRKNLDWAYDQRACRPQGRMSRQQWDKGNYPGDPVRRAERQTTAFIPQFSLQSEVEFEVALVPKVHAVYAGTRPLRFYIALRRDSRPEERRVARELLRAALEAAGPAHAVAVTAGTTQPSLDRRARRGRVRRRLERQLAGPVRDQEPSRARRVGTRPAPRRRTGARAACRRARRARASPRRSSRSTSCASSASAASGPVSPE